MSLLRRLANRLRRQELLDPELAALERIFRTPAATRRNTRKGDQT